MRPLSWLHLSWRPLWPAYDRLGGQGGQAEVWVVQCAQYMPITTRSSHTNMARGVTSLPTENRSSTRQRTSIRSVLHCEGRGVFLRAAILIAPVLLLMSAPPRPAACSHDGLRLVQPGCLAPHFELRPKRNDTGRGKAISGVKG